MSKAVLRSFRELLSVSKRLAPDKQQQTVEEVKSAIRKHRAEADEAKVLDLHKQLVSRISFLRMTTPRQPGEPSRIGAGVYVLRDGELVSEQAARSKRVADGKTSMEDFRQRHEHLLRRQHFGRTPPSGPKIF